MPIVAVGLGIWGAAALVEGGLTVMATIAAAGAVAAAVGTVTGNKDLTRIGSVMGLVGGVGALAQSAGVLTGGAGEVVATETASTGAEQLSGPPAEAASTPGAVAQETMQNVVPDAIPDAPKPGLVDAPAATPVAQASTPAADALKGPEQLSGPAPTGSSVLDAVKDYTKPMFDFAQKNQLLTYGMMQVGGSALQGLFDTTKESQKAALDARAAADTQQTAYLAQRTQNMGAPLPVATAAGPRRDVYSSTTRPPYSAPAPTGLLNSSVTGAPA